MHALLLNCGIFFSCIIFSLFSYPFRCLCTSSMQSSNKSSWKWIHVEYIEYVVICSNLFILEEGGKSLSIYHLPAKKTVQQRIPLFVEEFLVHVCHCPALARNPCDSTSTYFILMISGVMKTHFFPQTTKSVLLTLNISDNVSQSPLLKVFLLLTSHKFLPSTSGKPSIISSVSPGFHTMQEEWRAFDFSSSRIP